MKKKITNINTYITKHLLSWKSFVSLAVYFNVILSSCTMCLKWCWANKWTELNCRWLISNFCHIYHSLMLLYREFLQKYISLTSLAKTYLNNTRRKIYDLDLNRNHKIDPSYPVWITKESILLILYMYMYIHIKLFGLFSPFTPDLWSVVTSSLHRFSHNNIWDCLCHPSPNIQKVVFLFSKECNFSNLKVGVFPWIYHCRIVLHNVYCTMHNFWDICDLQYFNWYC